MSQLIECVPNFSEGRNPVIIDAIADAIRATSGVLLLDVDPGASTNRTVYTFVGGPNDIVEGALAAAKAAYDLIDMTKHKGEHPRMGALDVCPFVPVSGVSVEDCVEVSKIFGKRLAEELNVPVYLYGSASNKAYRKTMPQIRAGEYEGLSKKLQEPEWAPDFGEAEFVPKWGASVTGVRKFLIAYNVNMVATKEQAHRIALNLREQGRGPGEEGRLKSVQGIGWYLQEQNIAQISLNLTDFHVTPIHVAYEEAKKDAQELNLAVTGSEIVGLVPLEAILLAAEYYIKRENLFVLDESQKVHLVINRLGLSTISPFIPKQRIIEYCLEDREGELVSTTVSGFVRKVAARTPAPGGGSVAALVAALGSALGAMACQLTYGKRTFENLDSKMRSIIPQLHDVAENLIPLIDADSDAFNKVMEASKLPKGSDTQNEARRKAILDAYRESIGVPLKTLKFISSVWPAMMEAAKLGNLNCKSDIQVGAHCLEAGAFGAYYNVVINCENLEDEREKQKILNEAENLVTEAQKKCKQTLQEVKQRSN